MRSSCPSDSDADAMANHDLPPRMVDFSPAFRVHKRTNARKSAPGVALSATFGRSAAAFTSRRTIRKWLSFKVMERVLSQPSRRRTVWHWISEKCHERCQPLFTILELKTVLIMPVARTFGVTMWQDSTTKNLDNVTECHTFARFFCDGSNEHRCISPQRSQ